MVQTKICASKIVCCFLTVIFVLYGAKNNGIKLNMYIYTFWWKVEHFLRHVSAVEFNDARFIKQVCLFSDYIYVSFQRSGKLNYTMALEMTSYLQAEEEYVPWAAAIKSLNFIKSLLTATRPAYKHLQVGFHNAFFVFDSKVRCGERISASN